MSKETSPRNTTVFWKMFVGIALVVVVLGIFFFHSKDTSAKKPKCTLACYQTGYKLDPKACQCVEKKPFCGNGVADAGEQCGEPMLTCNISMNTEGPDGSNGYTCKKCKCIEKKPYCGNGVADSGEQCGEPTIGNCNTGYSCVKCKCVEIKPYCGNGVIDSGEQCGEDGLSCDWACWGTTCNGCKCVSNPCPHKDAQGNCTVPCQYWM